MTKPSQPAQQRFLAYLEKLTGPDPLISADVYAWALSIWAEVQARAPGVRAPVAGPSDDGALGLSWSDGPIVTSVDIFPGGGVVEWFHRDADGKLWGVDLPVAVLIDSEVIDWLPRA